MPMSMTYKKPLTERLLSLYHLKDLLTVAGSVQRLSSVAC